MFIFAFFYDLLCIICYDLPSNFRKLLSVVAIYIIFLNVEYYIFYYFLSFIHVKPYNFINSIV